MTRDEAIEKIKKCLALASSPEAHEAAAALRQAQKLMVQFGLNEADISLADVSEATQRAKNVPLVVWEAALASMVATAFGCAHLTTVIPTLSLSGRRQERHFIFIGVNPAAEIAAYAYEVLAAQCAKDRRKHMADQPKNCKPKTKVARGDRYAEGWISAISSKLEAFAGREDQKQLVSRYVDQKYPDCRTAKVKDRTKGRNMSDSDWLAGHRAGKNANLNHGIGARAEQQALTM